MKRAAWAVLLSLVLLLFTGCEQLLPEAESCYDRTRSFYETNGSLLIKCVHECQSIYGDALNSNDSYVVKKLDNGKLELRHDCFDGGSQKKMIFNENLKKVLDVSWITAVDFAYDYVAFRIDTLGSAERMLVYLPSDDPYAFYCKSDQWHPDDQWYPVVENGETIYKKRNDDNTVFFKQIGAHFFLSSCIFDRLRTQGV
ncbi:MAG: hypothetical protein II436_05965 [Oscillospiraceae bacterium]|nr:hypothetical protein [Oscillospiraceae bacterium]